jgi:hypothetical protein
LGPKPKIRVTAVIMSIKKKLNISKYRFQNTDESQEAIQEAILIVPK